MKENINPNVSAVINADEVFAKLREAEREAEHTGERFSSEDVLKAMRDIIDDAEK